MPLAHSGVTWKTRLGMQEPEESDIPRLLQILAPAGLMIVIGSKVSPRLNAALGDCLVVANPAEAYRGLIYRLISVAAKFGHVPSINETED